MLKFCPYCGAKIVDTSVKFCMNCGESLAKFMTPIEESSNTENKVDTKKHSETTRSVPTKKRSRHDNAALDMALIKCRQAADEGYKLARDNYAEIQNTLSQVKKRVASANAEESKVSRIQNTELIKALAHFKARKMNALQWTRRNRRT